MVMLLKRLIRPLIPDRLMVRFRLRQQSQNARWNVDVFVSDPKSAKRWLHTTPNTYRVRLDVPQGTELRDVSVVVDPELPIPSDLEELARSVLTDRWLGAAVVGETDPPRIVGRRRTEPDIGPRLVAVRDEILDEVGGVPGGRHPLPGLLARIRDAGHPTALLPVPRSGAPTHRRDSIGVPNVLILAAVPMHDVGGGARSTQLALEFVRQGWHTTVVSLYDAQESVDLGLRFVSPGLEQYPARRFDVERFRSRVAEPGLVLVEAPARSLIDLGLRLKDDGWTLVYDIIDDWTDPALGGEWFDPQAEAELVLEADRVVASAPDLVARADRMGRSAVLVPNAVNAGIFGVDLPPRPDDFPEAEVVIGYHGSLYGDWFDWSALSEVAKAFPEAAVVVIGDDKARRPEMPGNVHFLGLKPQSDLPAYLQRFDVGIVPFKVGETTHAVSPLKAYEYLASGVPVAAPPLRSLNGLDGVATGDLVSAVARAYQLPAIDRAAALSHHSWSARLPDITEDAPPSASAREVVVAVRPAAHHQAAARLLRSVEA
jgi:glycosyltransferase involved in cell wall biosynthesis